MFKSTYDKATKVWSGPKVPPIFNPDQNLGQLIVKVLEQTPDAETQISADTNVSVTCGEMRERILKFAVHLNNFGLKQGDVIGVVAGNTENIAPVVFACFLLGLPVNPLAPIMIESDIVQMFSKTKPKMIFCDEKNLRTVQNALDMMKSEAKIYTVMEKVDGYECVTEILKNDIKFEDLIYPEVDPNSTLMIICSSGSTGFPKGILKSHKNFLTEFPTILHYNPEGQNRTFLFSAIFWLSGILFLILGTLYKFTRIITTESFDAQLMVDIIKKYKVTHAFTPPFSILNILQLNNLEQLSSIKYWMTGGAIVDKNLCEKFKKFLPNGIIGTAYGSSEQGVITENKNQNRYGSVGVVVNNTSVKIIDENGKSLDNNQQGEICGKISTKFLDYVGDHKTYLESFDGDWFKTGDIGYFDDDGYLHVIDRKKELLKFNNYQVTPSELEAIVNEIDGIISSCVVGVLNKSSGNDIIHAFVIVDETKNLTETQIENFVNSKVIDAKKLRGGVHFVKSFELGLTGKVSRMKMRKIAEEKFT
ncbi:hypothetical protein PVAND_001085 [Polypedilum vanderplanki]|uniref:Uncharacterized protein n=1 Tax=Polypedilum vanderplanki TaxID=319348 RepID=A0A9J6BN45_POLVA|nr:hypothetical protein PVAND_001085 [Polypedilum vanderplanki]